DRCKVQNNVSIYRGVTLEGGVFVGPSAVFTNDLTPRANNETWTLVPTLVKRGTTIGANATIVCGVTIGPWSMVGAGAVVVADVNAYELVAGNPARRVGWVCECGQVLQRGSAWFSPTRCAACGRADHPAMG
ncbi:MAG: acyltransferase, partial [Actinomycetota bacterium]